MPLFTQKVEGGKQRRRRNARGGKNIGSPGDKTAEQLVIVGVRRRHEEVHDVGDVLSSPLPPR